MRRHRQFTALVLILALLAGALWFARWAKAGPLSESEILQRLGGVPIPHEVMMCTTTVATGSRALPSSSLVQIVAEAGSFYYNFATPGGLSVQDGNYLAENTAHIVQNGAKLRFLCVTRTGQSTASISIMR